MRLSAPRWKRLLVSGACLAWLVSCSDGNGSTEVRSGARVTHELQVSGWADSSVFGSQGGGVVIVDGMADDGQFTSLTQRSEGGEWSTANIADSALLDPTVWARDKDVYVSGYVCEKVAPAYSEHSELALDSCADEGTTYSIGKVGASGKLESVATVPRGAPGMVHTVVGPSGIPLLSVWEKDRENSSHRIYFYDEKQGGLKELGVLPGPDNATSTLWCGRDAAYLTRSEVIAGESPLSLKSIHEVTPEGIRLLDLGGLGADEGGVCVDGHLRPASSPLTETKVGTPYRRLSVTGSGEATWQSTTTPKGPVGAFWRFEGAEPTVAISQERSDSSTVTYALAVSTSAASWTRATSISTDGRVIQVANIDGGGLVMYSSGGGATIVEVSP